MLLRIVGRAEGVPDLSFISLFGKGSARGEPFASLEVRAAVRARVKRAISFHEALSANPVLCVAATRPTDETTDDLVRFESTVD